MVFIGDNREAAPLFVRPRCFNRRIERQQVGLVGNVLDQLRDFADGARAPGEEFDRDLKGLLAVLFSAGVHWATLTAAQDVLILAPVTPAYGHCWQPLSNAV